jgi:hypothetical protein
MAMTGLSTVSSVFGTRWMCSQSWFLWSSGVGSPSPIRATSPPAQKARPAPVTTMTFTLGSLCASASDFAHASIIGPVNALSLSGRFSVMVAILSFTS